ncbi:MAG: hypothetical protein ACO1OO_14830 [Flavisolibacter sp.]
MKFVVVAVFTVIQLLTSCCSTRPATGALVQGISGTVYEETGNRMPSPDRVLPAPKGLKTTVYVYETTGISQVTRVGQSPFYSNIATRLIDSTQTDEQGRFALALPAGRYSLFVKVNDLFYANRFDMNNTIAPVVVDSGMVREVNITVSASASY